MSELLQEIEPVEEPEEGWVCDDDQKAEWCMVQIRRAKAEKERWKAHYKAALETVNAGLDETIARMEHYLLGYYKTVPHRHTKTEEIYDLPSGKIMFKAQETKYEYEEADVIQWLKEHQKQSYIKVLESLDWGCMKDSLTVIGDAVADEDGEIIPCIKAIEQEPAFKVQIKNVKK